MIVHRGWFPQALEGLETAVRTTFQAIRADPRHCDSVVVADGPVSARAFGQWSMCAKALSPTDEAMLGELDRKASFDPSTFPERTVMRLLTSVAEVHARTFTAQQGAQTAPA